MLRRFMMSCLVVLAPGCGALMEKAPDVTGVWTGQFTNSHGRYNLTLYFSDPTPFDSGLKYTAKLVASGSTIPFDSAGVADNGALQLMTTVQVSELAGATVHPGEELVLSGTATATSLSGTARTVGPQAVGDIGTFSATR